MNATEVVLGKVKVRATAEQVQQLQAWARHWPDGYRPSKAAMVVAIWLAQQLLAIEEQVVDVQPKLAARVRLLKTGKVNKN